jgi:hypothetical protein
MEDKKVKQLEDQLPEERLKVLISIMESPRRERLGRFGDWGLTSKSLLERVFNLDDWCILRKDGKLFCFTIIHQEGCKGPCSCYCTETVADPLIKVYYLSNLFSQMISASHFQLYFWGEFCPKVLSNINDGLEVSSSHIKLFDIGEARTEEYLPGRDPEHRDADNKEFEKEESPEFQIMLNEFKSLISKYLMLAFTDPTSLPPFLLDVDEGPTMPLSELIAWAESPE